MSDFVFTATKGDDVPAGIWPARLTAIEEKVSKDGDTFRIWRFNAKVEDEFIEITAASSLSNASNSKSYLWIKAILGREPEVGEAITLDVLKGLTVNLVVVKDANGFGKVESLVTFTPGKKAKAPVSEAKRENAPEEVADLDAKADALGF